MDIKRCPKSLHLKKFTVLKMDIAIVYLTSCSFSPSLKVKYFDSGDYQMAKTSKRPLAGVGAAIPKPENIPHRKTSVPSKLASPTSVNPTSVSVLD